MIWFAGIMFGFTVIITLLTAIHNPWTEYQTRNEQRFVWSLQIMYLVVVLVVILMMMKAL